MAGAERDRRTWYVFNDVDVLVLDGWGGSLEWGHGLVAWNSWGGVGSSYLVCVWWHWAGRVMLWWRIRWVAWDRGWLQ